MMGIVPRVATVELRNAVVLARMELTVLEVLVPVYPAMRRPVVSYRKLSEFPLMYITYTSHLG